ncbi:MAG TPA: hypothetical protein VF746_03725 [Longimicrobium sp.]|jgi:hypothetical protein
MRSSANPTRSICSSAVALALGFGAAQTVAVPARDVGDAARVCNPQLCDRACRAIGAFGGTCLGNGSCVCYIAAP